MKFLYFFLFHLSFSLLAQEIVISRKGAPLKGTLLATDNKDKVILIISGSGPTDRNGNSAIGMTNNSLKMLAEDLAVKGIASLRFDKRGVAASGYEGFSEADFVFDDLVEDARAWVQFLVEKEYKSIIIIGHSQGSLIGMLVAQNSEKVTAFVSLAGIGKNVGDVLVEQIGAQMAELGEQTKILMDSIVAGHDPKKINPFLVSVFRPSIFPFLRSYAKYDPSIEIRRLKIPVLVVGGTTDIQVGIEHATLLSVDTEFKLVIYDGMNHILKPALENWMQNIATYNQPDLPLFDGLVDDLFNFINSLKTNKK